MLVPRGTEGGAQYQLFVMLSNYDLDRVITLKPNIDENTETTTELFFVWVFLIGQISG